MVLLSNYIILVFVSIPYFICKFMVKHTGAPVVYIFANIEILHFQFHIPENYITNHETDTPISLKKKWSNDLSSK